MPQPPAEKPIAPEEMPEEQTAEAPTTMASTQPAVAQSQPAVPDPQNGALAERLTSMATGLLRSQPPSNAIWRYTQALLEAATRLAPDEPRYQRLLVEAAGRAGDEETILKTLERYRKLVPNDEYAQVQLIDLYLKRMQSADDRINYLKSIIDSPAVANGVRSFAAMRLAGALAERMQNDLANEAVGVALKLNPLNLDALRLQLQHVQQNGSPADRLAAEFSLLQSNPAQPAVALDVAREFADAGMVQRSLEWFRQAVGLHRQMGLVPGADLGVDFASELFISGDTKQALGLMEQVTNANPDDLNAWLLKLIVARNAGNKELQTQTIQKAHVALTNRMALLAKQAGSTTATTRPMDFTGEVPLPDPMADLALIQQNKPDLVQQYAPVAGGMAWLKVFFEEKPAQAVPFTNAVAKAIGEGHEVTARLQGWQYLVAGNNDEARVKLSAVADRDPIAALGMIRLAGKDAAAEQKAVEQARQMLQQAPSRLTGAFLYAELAPRGVTIKPTATAPMLEKVLEAFPKDWMKIIDQPQTFYAARIEPVSGRVSVPVGEPVLVQATITNIGRYPLTMGPEGVIHPDLWFDAQTRGVQPNFYPAEAFARMGCPILLMPNQSVSQVVRLDQAQLLATLERYPAAHFQIMAMMMTNPTTIGGQVRPGPAGTQVALSNLMERRGAPVGQLDVRQKLADAIQSGTPEEKIRAAETLTKFATLFTARGAGEEARAFGAQAAEAVRHTATDQDPTVRAWASYLFSVYTGDQGLLTKLQQDPSWVARILGIVATDYTGKDQSLYKDLAANDEELLVRRLAAAALEAQIAKTRAAAAAAAATQPSEAVPSSQPASTQPAAPVPAASTTGPSGSAPAPAPAPSNGASGGLRDVPTPPLTPAVPTTTNPPPAPAPQGTPVRPSATQPAK